MTIDSEKTVRVKFLLKIVHGQSQSVSLPFISESLHTIVLYGKIINVVHIHNYQFVAPTHQKALTITAGFVQKSVHVVLSSLAVAAASRPGFLHSLA